MTDNRAKTSKDNLGAYTNPKWKLGKTIAIRIPEAIKDQVLSFARELDIGVEKKDTTQLVNEAIKKLEYAVQPKSEGGVYDGRKATELKTRVLEAIEILKSAE